MLNNNEDLQEKQDDDSLLEGIYADYKSQMLYVARQILGNDADAEDAVHDALLSIAKQQGSLPHDDPRLVRSYVLTAAKNSAINIRDRYIRRDRESIVDPEDPRLSADDRLFERVTASMDYSTLIDAMLKLPDKYREVMMLHYVHEMKLREIAEFLGRKESTVHQQITRGKKQLVELCKKEGLTSIDI